MIPEDIQALALADAIGALDPEERRELEARLAALPLDVRAEVALLYDTSVDIAAGVLGVLLFGVAIYNYCRVYCCAPIHLKLSGGNVCPLRSEMARNICSEVHAAGIVLESARDTNSDSICADVDTHKLDLGLVLGGFPAGRYPNVREVAALGVEPLHLVVRPEIAFDQLHRGEDRPLRAAGAERRRAAVHLVGDRGLRLGDVRRHRDDIRRLGRRWE